MQGKRYSQKKQRSAQQQSHDAVGLLDSSY